MNLFTTIKRFTFVAAVSTALALSYSSLSQANKAAEERNQKIKVCNAENEKEKNACKEEFDRRSQVNAGKAAEKNSICLRVAADNHNMCLNRIK